MIRPTKITLEDSLEVAKKIATDLELIIELSRHQGKDYWHGWALPLKLNLEHSQEFVSQILAEVLK